MPNNHTIQKSIATKLQPFYEPAEANAIARLLFDFVSEKYKNQSSLQLNYSLTEDDHIFIQNSIVRLLNSEPLQYITGECWFRNFRLNVGPSVLIPRPETEELVQRIINDIILIQKSNLTNVDQDNAGVNYLKDKRSFKILDVGTGSGCIAIALKKAIPYADVVAMDVSEAALSIAKANAANLGTKVNFICDNILNLTYKPGYSSFDCIVSNPPYITLSEKDELNANVVKYEPHLALFVDDENPFLYYDAIAEFATEHLHNMGSLYFEINQKYGEELKKRLLQKKFTDVTLMNDMSGNARFLKCVKS